MLDDEHSDLIDEVPGIAFDRAHSVRSSVRFDDSDLTIYLDMQCEATERTNGTLAALRVVGLVLEFWVPSSPPASRDRGAQMPIIPWLIKFFHAKMSTFPHLRVAELRAPLVVLRRAVQVAPEISQLPTLGGQFVYKWAGPEKDFENTQSSECESIGVDPATLEPTGACISLLVGDVFVETESRILLGLFDVRDEFLECTRGQRFKLNTRD